jgi:hypothetical protein
MDRVRTLETCEWWAVLPTQMPRRTFLFHLEPCARGTGMVESMTSYLARLAQAHGVSTGCLLSKVVAPRMTHGGLASRNRLQELFGRAGNSFDGNSATVSEVINAVEALTGHNGLSELTMLPCGRHVSCRGLIRTHQAWCPDCLQGWHDLSQTIYLPLLWHLEAVSVCPIHRCRLVERCPHCHSRRGALTRHSRPGFCPACKQWLGVAQADRVVTPPTEWEMFAAQKSVDFVAQVPKAFSEPSQSHFAANVRSLRSVTFQGNKSPTARAILHSRKTIECWCGESQNPMLLSLLLLSFRLGVEPISLLTEDVSDRILVGSNAPGGPCIPVVRRTARRHNRKRLHAALVRIVEAKEDPPPSMHKIALRLKCHQSYLARAFPDLVAELKSRHQSFIGAHWQVRKRLVRDLVRSATLKAHVAGVYPSANRVCRGLPRFVDMRDPAAREEWKKTLTELGLHHEER